MDDGLQNKHKKSVMATGGLQSALTPFDSSTDSSYIKSGEPTKWPVGVYCLVSLTRVTIRLTPWVRQSQQGCKLDIGEAGGGTSLDLRFW